jgi:hypothetical protein
MAHNLYASNVTSKETSQSQSVLAAIVNNQLIKELRTSVEGDNFGVITFVVTVMLLMLNNVMTIIFLQVMDVVTSVKLREILHAQIYLYRLLFVCII